MPVVPRHEHHSDDVPTGVIWMFGGAVAPSGWHLCDGSVHGSTKLAAVIGSANAPDLRDRFVIGASATKAVGSTGGEATVTLTEAQMPAHSHSDPTSTAVAGSYEVSSHTPTWGVDYIGGAQTSTTGGSQAHNNMPPWYALVMIIKK